jgi:hypothetical protein
MSRHRSHKVGALVIGLALLGGPTVGVAHADLLDSLRAAHARQVRIIKNAHALHMGAIHMVVSAHHRHMQHAPRPVREVHNAVYSRHQQHVRAVERADRWAQRRHTEHERDVSGAVAVVQRHHREHLRAVGLSEPERDVASVGASVDARVARAHERHVGVLERIADWLVGVA